jgi:formylglycine-generating enzyme required for sulfatase activity
VGARDPAAPADWTPPPDLSASPVLLDAGLPTERYAKGNSRYGADLATRVGCRATPTSDRGTALATYWGISELGGPVIPLTLRGYRGTHGSGMSPAGKPGASVKRVAAPFNDTPPDWPDWGAYTAGHFVGGTCRLVVSADNRIKKALHEPAAPAAVKPAASPATQPPRTDTIKISNVKWDAGAKDSSTISFDLAWNDSWRAQWEEPAEKNVTGKPLKVESWDAAWVFVKFRPAGAKDDLHGTLAVAAADHRVPAGADLAVGLTDDGSRGTGVFIYRKAAGVGANDFKGIQLRWLHAGGQAPTPDTQVSVHALAMVYIPEGPFASRSPWGHALMVINTPKATQSGGHLESGPETVPLSDEWPNGFPAYYCMKYSITQGEYVNFLNSIPSLNVNGGRYGVMAMENPRFYSPDFYTFNGYTITRDAAGVFKADVPDRRCNLLSLFDIQGFIAWAGLRMPTNLEYEKACRGPRAVARGAEAWTPATCAPASSLGQSVLGASPAVGPGPSYWGIRELSLSGCVQEWPAVIQNERAVEGHKGVGVGDRGLHGSGSPEIPESWPWNCFGEWYYGGIWRIWGYGTVGHWVYPEDLNRMPWATMDANRTGRYGVRAVRTAPLRVNPNAMLQIDALPKLTGIDIGVFYLSGRLNNTGDKPVNVELTIPVPDACFLDGASSRALAAAPKAVTPFKITMALTHQSVMTGAIRGGMLLPVRLQGKDGQVLEQLLVPIQMGASAGAPLPVLSSVRGGEVALRITNTTDRALTLAVRLSPVGVTLAETNRSVTLAAGAEAKVVFAAPRQAFTNEGPFRIPYGIAVATAAPQSGEAAVQLRTESRWWISKRVKGAPKSGAFDEGSDSGDDMAGALAGLGDLVSYDGGIFKVDKPSKDWTPVTCGVSLAFGDAGKLPSHGSAMLAATRVEASADREAVMAVQHATKERFDVTVWVNDAMVFKMSGNTKIEAKPFTIRKAGNTMMLECRSAETGAVTPGALSLQFSGAKDGKPINGLLFDMEKR